MWYMCLYSSVSNLPRRCLKVVYNSLIIDGIYDIANYAAAHVCDTTRLSLQRTLTCTCKLSATNGIEIILKSITR